MNDSFLNLTTEKREEILNAAMRVFSMYEYKKASTDDIAAYANISKGMLFYYFNNKAELYEDVYDFAHKIIEFNMIDEKLLTITDFYDLITYATHKKMQVLKKYPYLMNFSIRSYYTDKEDISETIRHKSTSNIKTNYHIFFKNIDIHKFKEGIDPYEVYKMMVWMVDGYLHEKMMNNELINPDESEMMYLKMVKIMKPATYKEEYL